MIDGVLWLNYIAFVVFVNNLPGPLAKTLHLRSSFFDAFSDIGSQSAKFFLQAKLRRASDDPAAAQLRSETDGPRDYEDLQTRLEASLKLAMASEFLMLFRNLQQDALAREAADQQWRTSLREAIGAWHANAERTSEALTSLITRVANLPLALGQKISDVVFASVMNPGSALIKNLRAATKKTAVRNTHSARRFPPAQKATQLEVLSFLISLLSVAVRHFPQMTYDTWKSVRSNFGKAVKKARLQRHALGEASPEYLDRPLLWSFAGDGTAEGGGQRYVVLREHESLVETVWTVPRSISSGRRRRVESFDAEAKRVQAASAARPGYATELWPLLSAEVEPDFPSSEEE